MSTLKQKLAEKIKKAADQKKRQLLQQQQSQRQSQRNFIGLQVPQPIQMQQNKNNQNSDDLALKAENQKNFINSNEIQVQQPKIPSHTLQVLSFKEQQLNKSPFIVQTQSIQENQQDIEKQIQIMVKQKQSRKKQDQEEKKKQMILNSIKNKRRPRPPKPMDKPTPFNQLSPPYQQIKIFAAYLPIYQQRRRRQLYSTIVDLGVKNLQQVILQCFLQGLISKNFMKSIKERGVERQIQFVRKFAENRLHEYDFQATKFTPLDHRGLCGLLLKHDKKYILGERIYCVFKQITDFYQVIYAMEEHQYQKLCQTIRIKYKLNWRQSAFKNLYQFDQEALVKFDTSSIFQLRPSPMFGADLNDDQKQFFKAKQAKYPDKVKPQTKKQTKVQNKQSSVDSKQSDISDSFSGSLDQSQIEKQLQGESQLLSSSNLKSSQIKSTLKRLRRQRKQESRQPNSSTLLRNSSSIASEISGYSDDEDFQDFDTRRMRDKQDESESDSMYQSKVKYAVLDKNKKIQKKKQKAKSKESSSRVDSSQFVDPDIFQQFSD